MKILAKCLFIAASLLLDNGGAYEYNTNLKKNHHGKRAHSEKAEVLEYDDGCHLAVSKIIVKWGDEIDSIVMTYIGTDGTMIVGDKNGGKGGGKNTTIALEKYEGIIGVVGTKHKNSGKHGLQELSFKTDKDRTFSIITDGRFEGENYGKEFSHKAPQGSILGGISGKAGKWLNTLDCKWVTKDEARMDMLKIPGSPFMLKKKDLSWEDHEKEATSLGYELAAISSKNEEKTVVDFLQNLPEKSNEKNEIPGLWIGGKRLKGMVFTWRSEKRVKYTHWHKFEPSNSGGKQNCIELMERDNGWGWNDDECTVRKYALYAKTTDSLISSTAS